MSFRRLQGGRIPLDIDSSSLLSSSVGMTSAKGNRLKAKGKSLPKS